MSGEDAIAKLEEQVTCSICLDRFKDPKVLQCHHAYCKKCLEKLLDRARQTMVDPVFDCPKCRKHTPVPLSGASGLDPAFHIVQLLDVREALKRAQGLGISIDEDPSTEEAELSSLPPPPPPKKLAANMCPKHVESERNLYCEDCGEVICFQCVKKSHEDHKYDLVTEVAEAHKEKLKFILDPLENRAMRMERAIKMLGDRHSEVIAQRDSIEGEIHSLIDELHSILDTRRAALIGQLDKLATKKLKILNEEKDDRETVHCELTSTARGIKDALTKKSDTDMLACKKELVRRAEESKKDFEAIPDLLSIDVEADMIFSAPENVKSSWVSLGQVLIPTSPDPANCIVLGEGLQKARVEETAIVMMKARNYRGEPIDKEIPSLDCTLMYQETPLSCEVEKKEQNLYEISYMPANRGKHELHIKIEDEHIKMSPFSIEARVPIEKLGIPVMTFDSVRPWSCVLNKAGELLVAECNVHRVGVYSPSGKRLQTLGGKGSHKMQFNHPCGITVDDDDNIYVAEGSNFRLQKFTRTGRHIGYVGQKGNGPSDFQQPKCLAFNSVNKKIYLADLTSVKVYNTDLTFYKSIGSKGRGAGKFTRVFGVACAPDGNVYVSDSDHKNIQVFTPDGHYIRGFPCEVRRNNGWNLFGGKESSSPNNIYIDKNYLYMSSESHYCMAIYTLEGKLIHSFGSDGFESGEFRAPHGVAISESGMVYVCDYQNDRIQVF